MDRHLHILTNGEEIANFRAMADSEAVAENEQAIPPWSWIKASSMPVRKDCTGVQLSTEGLDEGFFW